MKWKKNQGKIVQKIYKSEPKNVVVKKSTRNWKKGENQDKIEKKIIIKRHIEKDSKKIEKIK